MQAYRKIGSPVNPRIKHLIQIRERTLPGDTWFVEGLNAIGGAIDAGIQIRELFCTEKVLDETPSLARIVRGPDITIISEKVAQRLSATASPRGAFATVLYCLRQLHDFESSVIPVLDRIQDPGNMGAILRSADAFGFREVMLIEGGCSPANQKVMRSSAGSLFHLEIAVGTEEELLEWLHERDRRLFYADPRAERALDDILPLKNAVVILGNEASGVSEKLRKDGEGFRVPMPGRAESLNVAVTAGIIFYELMRKRKTGFEK